MENTLRATMSTSRSQRLFRWIKDFFPALKIVLLTIPLSIFDFGTDVFWTKRYLTSTVDIVQILGVLLLSALIIHNCVASFYGMSILIRQPDAYPRLWKTTLRRVCTGLLHLLGLGSLVFHLDYLADLMSLNSSARRMRHGWRRKKRSENDSVRKSLPVWKERHLESMQIIQAFVEAFPQFILQTAALLISWTNGTETQCFPSKLCNAPCLMRLSHVFLFTNTGLCV